MKNWYEFGTSWVWKSGVEHGQEKVDRDERVKKFYIGLFCTSAYLYLNHAKNPFNY